MDTASTAQPTATCSTCRHWRKVDAKGSGRVQALAVGECRFMPPVGTRQWPRTQDTDHCHQYKPAAKAKALQGELIP